MKLVALIGKSVVALFALNFAAVVVVALMMMSKGYLTRDKIARAAEVLRSQPAPLVPVAEGGLATQPAEGVPAPISLDDRERALAAVRDEMDAEIQNVRGLQAMVERARVQLEADRAAFETERKAFSERRDTVLAARRAAGLEELVKTIKVLKAPRIKEILADQSDEEMARILVGLDTRLRGKVIDEYKTPEDLERIRTVLQLIRDGAVVRMAAGTAGAS